MIAATLWTLAVYLFLAAALALAVWRTREPWEQPIPPREALEIGLRWPLVLAALARLAWDAARARR